MNGDLKELRERGYDRIADVIEDGFKRWDYRLKRRGRSLAECYIDGNVRFQLDALLRVVGDSSVPEKNCLWQKFPDRGAAVENLTEVVATFRDSEANRSPRDTFCVTLRWGGHASGEKPVLVDTIQLVELPEWVVAVAVPSVVRLERLYGNGGDWVDAPDLSPLGVGVHRPLMEDRELRGGDLLLTHVWCVTSGQRKRQVVEGRPGLKNAISDQDAEAIWHRINSLEPESPTLDSINAALMRGIRIAFIDNRVWTTFDPCLGLTPERLEMFFSPVEL